MSVAAEDTNNCGARTQKKPGGWKAMPYILGNEAFASLGWNGMFANFLVYLTRELHIDMVDAANMMSIWYGLSNFGPLIGAFISDAYVGRFKTIAFTSLPNLLGMMVVTLTAWLPELHPPPCTPQQLTLNQCVKPSKTHLLVLLLGFLLLAIGSSGIKPCSIPFGVDQFDASTEEGRRGIVSFFNWSYTISSLVFLVTQTVVIYVQDSVSWTLGFGIPTVCMFLGLVLFFVGTRIYVHVKPQGSILSGVAQVLVAAYRKRKVQLPNNFGEDDDIGRVFYDPPLKDGSIIVTKLPLTNQFRALNKAALIMEGELNTDGIRVNPWRLTSIQQVEEVKCLVGILPIWATGIFTLTSIIQLGIFTISQALKMDRNLGPRRFQIPAASFSVISFLTIGLWVPIYDRILVPSLRKITHHEGGITLLQRIGIGLLFCVVSLVAAGFVERARRGSVNPNPNPTMSAMWLALPLILMGLCEAFSGIGMAEFLNRQCPEHMRSISNSLLSCSWGVASYVSSFMITIVHRRTSWLANDLNVGRLELFYYLIAGLGVLNLGFFLFVAHRYQYKSLKVQDVDNDDDANGDVELVASKASV
ncbi:protein NRT1/ PTR FAMILY 2.13-like [Prosopis cineraria]|uniref:protein NRT1/ PTR FAMILY 2.13-like n=1 Tax=Prosopis cineraria TaxID=364024 RepID=UPI00240F0086|nr:protein NRT1/ PTR FAMILY 2.13-like [Prosopis cineraria]XP_054822908.1 protein NRT1/ PTR FAMILY 2.13-like [Prosopis cineraria]